MKRSIYCLKMTLPAGWKIDAKRVLPEYLGTELVRYVHESYKTGVMFAKVSGPVINLGMGFTTEINNSSGVTHCLEHLCFKESVSHQKGVLDLLATRCGSDGTNAYTTDDHTMFTLNMVGQPALVKVMPVFVNHILAPKLSNESFMTEIFHINGKGENQGVVYSEMTGRENTDDDLMWNEITKLLFGVDSPYSHEAGGHSSKLATITNKEITDYHKNTYTTDNLNVIITGDVSHHEALLALSNALDTSISDGASVICRNRGFSSLMSQPTDEDRKSKGRGIVYYPSDDTSQGTLMFAAKIPGGIGNLKNPVAADVVLRFFKSIPSSPLNQSFVHIDEPIASYVTGGVEMSVEPYLYLQFCGVPYSMNEELAEGVEHEEIVDSETKEHEEEEEDCDTEWFTDDQFRDLLIEEIKKIIESLKTDPKSYQSLQHSLRKERISDQEDFEDDPHETLLDGIIPDLIFSEYPGHNLNFGDHIDRCPQFDSLLEKDKSWWIDFITEAFLTPLIDNTAAEVKAIPSEKLSKKIKRDKEKVTKQNIKRFGKASLSTLQSHVDKAEEKEKVKLSDDVKNNFPIETKLSEIKEIPRTLSHTKDSKSLEVMDVGIESCFITTRVFFNYQSAPLELARYAYLLNELLLESDSNSLNYKQTCEKLDEDFVTSFSSIGRYSSFMRVTTAPHIFGLAFYSEPDKAGLISEWVSDLLLKTKINPDCLKSKCKNLLSDISENSCDQNAMADQAMVLSTYDVCSYPVLNSMFSQKLFLKRCLEDLPLTMEKLNELLKYLSHSDTPAAAVVGGSDEGTRKEVIKGLGDVLAPRPHLFSKFNIGDEIRNKRTFKSEKSFVYGMASADTATIHLIIPSGINPQSDPKQSHALDVLCESISMQDSELQLAIRGRGLAYHASVYCSKTSGDIIVYIDSCTNVEKCIEGALEVLRDIPDLEASQVLSDFSIRNSKGSTTYTCKSARATSPDTISQVTGGCFRQCFSLEELAARESHIDDITYEDLLSVYNSHISRLLDNTTDLVVAVVCNSADVDRTVESVKQLMGISPTPYKSSSDLFIGFDKLVSNSIEGK